MRESGDVDRWKRIEALLPEALDLPAGERDGFLDRVCGDDAALRAELAELIAAHERTGLLDGPLTRATARPAPPLDDLRSGAIVGHYAIESRLGTGGMGEVFRARDMVLERTVALKFLPHALDSDPSAKRRFLVEARAAAALDHPNVCAVHEIGETEDGRLFIAMALVDGEPLRDRIARGPLDMRTAVEIACGIAAALEAAHARGIVHRDVKPANVMLAADGTVKLVDFGIAKLAGMGQTITGATPGTVAYMSPEQVRGEGADERADVWSAGVVLYEMLAGRRPFTKENDAATLNAILHESPPPLHTLRPDVPAQLERVAGRALEKNRERRYDSATELRRALGCVIDASNGAGRKRRRMTAPMLAGAALLLLAGTAAGLVAWRSIAEERAVASLPRIAALADAGDYVAAFELAERAERVLGADSTVERLMTRVADRFTILSEPAGADVRARRIAPDGTLAPDSVRLGRTPVRDLRLARADYRLTISLDGYTAAERIASSALGRAEATMGVPTDVTVSVPLRPIGDVPDGMVSVPGGEYALVGREAPVRTSVQLPEFFIDAHEVTNAEYRAFVVAGGYSDPRYWQHPFVRDGRELSWDEAMRLFVDRTGLPGPRGWSNQEFVPGEESHPVTGVSWYEAAAYAAFAGGRLPTLFEWEKAARDGRYTHFELMVMPWGLADPTRGTVGRANFSGRGSHPVGSHPGGVSPYGAHDMAGNVEEWLLNPVDDRRFIAGGAWDDPLYVFGNYLAVSPFYATSTLGFRTVREVEGASGDPGAFETPADARTPTYRPVDDATYRALLNHYAYDRAPLEPRVLERTVSEDWIRETVAIAGPWPDPTLLHLYLPARAQPPYHLLVFLPGSNTFMGALPADETEHIMGPHVKSGRAVMIVVVAGMRGRPWPADRHAPTTSSVQYRQEMVMHATELRRALDYIETRPDIDAARIAYVGFSRGSGSWLPFAAVDPRWRSVVLIGGGIDERMRPLLPEVDPVNFAQRIRAPVLLLNGLYDEEHPWEQRALPLWRLLAEPKRLELVEGGHLPMAEARVPVINAWLDETLGVVR